MSQDDDALEKWRREHGIPDEEYQLLTSPELRTLRLFEKLTAQVATNEEESRKRDERMQRDIDFIVNQQAQFVANMQQLRDAQARSEQRWERAERMWASTEESVRALLDLAQRHDEEINTLRESQAQTDRQMRETDERINALVNAVEALVSQRRNGGSDAREV